MREETKPPTQLIDLFVSGYWGSCGLFQLILLFFPINLDAEATGIIRAGFFALGSPHNEARRDYKPKVLINLASIIRLL